MFSGGVGNLGQQVEQVGLAEIKDTPCQESSPVCGQGQIVGPTKLVNQQEDESQFHHRWEQTKDGTKNAVDDIDRF